MKQLRQISSLALTLFLFAFAKNFPQSDTIEILGSVIDGVTRVPVENAVVFLSFTTFHSQTNSKGEFRLSGVIPGTYAMICIADSFPKVTQRIDVTGRVNLRANFVLDKPSQPIKKVIGLESFIERDKFVEKFKKELLGESIRTFKCSIPNTDDIEFTHNGVELFAKSSKPIIIMNKSLGYKITVYLNEFTWEWFSDYGSISLDTYFENLPPGDSTEALRFLANRKEAYNGSFKHFLRACAARKVFSEGFRVFETAYVPNELGEYEDFKNQVERQRTWQTAGLIESIMEKKGENEFQFNTDSYLEVVYIENKEDPNYALYKERIFATTELYEFQDSWIKFPAGKYIFNERGIGLENRTIQKQVFGYLAWKRLSDSLPSDYEPTEDE